MVLCNIVKHLISADISMHKLYIFTALVFSSFIATSTAAETETSYQMIEWTELIPKEDLDILLNPPEILSAIVDGSEMDSLENQQTSELLQGAADKYFSALQSTKVIDAFDGKNVRMPGFIVPLDFTEEQLITSFFLVPYFGACLHSPPPPPNQIVYARFPDGLQIETLDTPFWLEGKIKIEQNQNELGLAAYAMDVDQAFVYEE